MSSSDSNINRDKGGTVIAEGTPEEVAESPVSYTGKYIKPMLER